MLDLYKELDKPEPELDDTPLFFGKHAGLTPDEISELDPSYLVYLYEDSNIKHCSKAMYEYCRKEVQIRSRDDELL